MRAPLHAGVMYKTEHVPAATTLLLVNLKTTGTQALHIHDVTFSACTRMHVCGLSSWEIFQADYKLMPCCCLLCHEPSAPQPFLSSTYFIGQA